MTTSTELTTEQWNDRVMEAIVAKLDDAMERTGSRYSKHSLAKRRGDPNYDRDRPSPKSARIIAALKAHPTLTHREIAKLVNCSETQVGRYRRKLALGRKKDDLKPRGEVEARVLAAIAQNPDAGHRVIADLANASYSYVKDVFHRMRLAKGDGE